MLVYLKVKVKSLAAEARIIKLEERRHRGTVKRGLQDHRKKVIRPEARATQLAYAFLRGKSYSATERSTKPVNWANVWSMAKRFAPTTVTEAQLATWHKLD